MKEIELKDTVRQPVECWTRVMGYFRPVSHFNEGKKSEFANRKWFVELFAQNLHKKDLPK